MATNERWPGLVSSPLVLAQEAGRVINRLIFIVKYRLVFIYEPKPSSKSDGDLMKG
jgi:hypothetical protein